jgi:[acyl-carrier-protein] S-malonyltransferase
MRVQIAALFPGQGSQVRGMGKSLAAAFGEAAAVFDEASEVLGVDVRALLWDSPASRLAATENAQPALVIAGLAAWRVLERRGVVLRAAAGHSVGALAALVATGRLDLAEAVRLARLRGELMARAPGSGGMCAVIAADGERTEALAVAERLGLDVAADNSPRQFVVSGPLDTVRAFAEVIGPRAKLLDVSHAFHSRMMAAVEGAWTAAVEQIDLLPSCVPVGLAAAGSFSADSGEIAKDLMSAVSAPVRWWELMETMPPDAHLVGLGPAKALVGLARHFPARPAMSLVDSPAAVNAFLSRYAEEPK